MRQGRFSLLFYCDCIHYHLPTPLSSDTIVIFKENLLYSLYADMERCVILVKSSCK